MNGTCADKRKHARTHQEVVDARSEVQLPRMAVSEEGDGVVVSGGLGGRPRRRGAIGIDELDPFLNDEVSVGSGIQTCRAPRRICLRVPPARRGDDQLCPVRRVRGVLRQPVLHPECCVVGRRVAVAENDDERRPMAGRCLHLQIGDSETDLEVSSSEGRGAYGYRAWNKTGWTRDPSLLQLVVTSVMWRKQVSAHWSIATGLWNACDT